MKRTSLFLFLYLGIVLMLLQKQYAKKLFITPQKSQWEQVTHNQEAEETPSLPKSADLALTTYAAADNMISKKNEESVYFSIHKSMASAIQFDLCLKKNNTRQMWILPKGISCNPLHKKDAIKTPMPFERYIEFEGVITQESLRKTIMLWDHGQIKLKRNSKKNSFTLVFMGKRIEGAYLLEQEARRSKNINRWTITKIPDAFADTRKNLIRLFNKSVTSNRTFKQIEQKEQDGHPINRIQ